MLYQRYYKPLVLFAMRFMDDQMAAEDVVEDVMVAVYERSTPFSSVPVLQAYLCNAVRNRALNHVKHQSVHERYASDVVTEREAYDVHPLDSPADFVEQQYVSLFQAMDALPARCREVMLLLVEGKSNAEIAEVLRLSIETVKTHRKRAIRMLRERVG